MCLNRTFLLAMAALFAVMLAAPAPAQICSTMCSRYESGNCVEHEQTCVTPGGPSNSFGAIAYGRSNGAYGYSYRMSTRQSAESTAVRNCAEHGSDCEIMVWYDRKCGAVVARSDTTNAYWGLGDNERQASASAMNQCVKDKGKECQVKVAQCSK